MTVFYPLSANPLHDGHKFIYNKMKQVHGKCCYVLSTSNADKGNVDRWEIYKRLEQFDKSDDVLLFNTAIFYDMVEPLKQTFGLKQVMFAVGIDTFERIVNPKYYRCDILEVTNYFRSNNVYFQVFSRNGLTLDQFCNTIQSTELKDSLYPISNNAGPSLNISSTELRNEA